MKTAQRWKVRLVHFFCSSPQLRLIIMISLQNRLILGDLVTSLKGKCCVRFAENQIKLLLLKFLGTER